MDTELKEVGVDIEIERGRCGSLRKKEVGVDIVLEKGGCGH